MSPNSAATLRIPRPRAWVGVGYRYRDPCWKGNAAGTEQEEKGDVVGTEQEENDHVHGGRSRDERIPNALRSGVRLKVRATFLGYHWKGIWPSDDSGMGIQAPDRRLGSFWHCLKFFLALLIMSAFICGAPACKEVIGSASALSRHQNSCPTYRKFMAQTFSDTVPNSDTLSGGPSLKNTHRRGPPGPKQKSALPQRKDRTRVRGPPTNASAGPSFTPNADADVIMHTPGPDPSDFGNEGPPEIPSAPSPEALQAPPSPEPLQTLLAPDSLVTETGPRKRTIRLPKRFRDLLPEALPSDEVEDPPQTSSERTVHTMSCRISSTLWNLPSPGPRKEIFPLRPTLPNLS
ncbi:hypothetical protein DFH07DRAFT_773665 [Mycena maculata]|uniref:Uncharacterized protein n=1 Tax=Mycena maculata TaxID=230809 RepID=A0AAD7NC97_9AGAR|nr:hypothetical protein DFH07DRAFT_773665 [Mycena maculata]